MTDRGAHVIDIGQMANDTDDTGPVEIEAKGVQNPGSIFNAFWDYNFENTYRQRRGDDRLDRRAARHQVRRHRRLDLRRTSTAATWRRASRRSSRRRSATTRSSSAARPLPHDQNGHRRQFLDCIKSRQQPFAHAEVGHRTASICHLNNIAMAVGRKLKWDPKAEQFVGDDEANKLLQAADAQPVDAVSCFEI